MLTQMCQLGLDQAMVFAFFFARKPCLPVYVSTTVTFSCLSIRLSKEQLVRDMCSDLSLS